jgi:two-component system sensor histidine kinase CreC
VSIRLVLVLAFAALVAAGVLVVTRIVNDEVPRYTYAANEESLVDTATLLAAFVEVRSAAGRLPVAELRSALDVALARDLKARIHELEKRSLGLRVYLTDPRGIVVFDSDGGRDEGKDYSRWQDVYRTLRGEYGARATRGVAAEPLTSIHYVAAPIRSEGRIVGVLSVGKPVRELSGLIGAMRTRITRAGVVGLGLAVTAGIGVALWISRPLRRLVEFSDAVASGRRVSPPRLYGREVRELGRSLDGMREALWGRRQAEGAIRGLTHEIKAPLAGIQASAELLGEDVPLAERRRFLGHILTETERIQTLVERMLELAALEGRASLETRPELNLAALVADVIAAEAALAEQKGVRLETRAEEAVAVCGDALLLRQAVRNLVHNALRATPAEGTVVVSAEPDGEAAVVAVEDTGPGVPDYALPRLFERFYSVTLPGEARRGTGLGLAFVREVALLHGGEAALVNRPQGGARATLRLPRGRA